MQPELALREPKGLLLVRVHQTADEGVFGGMSGFVRVNQHGRE